MSAATLQAELTLTRAELQVVRAERDRLLTQQTKPRYTAVYCSQCGRGFGPGNSGFSHCRDHAEKRAVE